LHAEFIGRFCCNLPRVPRVGFVPNEDIQAIVKGACLHEVVELVEAGENLLIREIDDLEGDVRPGKIHGGEASVFLLAGGVPYVEGNGHILMVHFTADWNRGVRRPDNRKGDGLETSVSSMLDDARFANP
jgi:hypothetical protein